MNKLLLMRNPKVFQGEKYLNSKENYFEGWYFKNSNDIESVSFIPGININEKNQKAFIQVITKDSSYFINYDIKDFKYNFSPFSVQIGENLFSEDNVRIKIKDEKKTLKYLERLIMQKIKILILVF